MATNTTLAQYAMKNPPSFDTMVYSKLATVSPLLSVMNFKTISGSSYKYLQEATLPTTQFRALNASVTASNGTNAQIEVNLAHAAGLATLDDFFDPSVQNDQIDKAIRAMGLNVNEAFFTGDKDSNNEFDGMAEFVTDGYATEVETATNGAALSLGVLDEAVLECRGDNRAIFVNDTIYLRMQTAARSASVGGALQYMPDQLGLWSTFYNGIHVYRAGKVAAGTQVLPFGETQGSSDVCTSAYIVSLDSGLAGLQKASMNMKKVETAFGSTISFGWDVAAAVLDKEGVVKLSGITDAAITA